MKQVSIIHDSIITNQATFATQEEAESWIAYHNFSGEVIFEDVTLKLEQEAINEASSKLLQQTDWYILRELDSGILCPQEVKQARAEARAKITKL